MILKHSLKTLIRTPVKTLLFFLLITAITCASTLGASMYSSSQNMLAAAQEQYTTVGHLEYIGQNYPTYSSYDAALANTLEDIDFDSYSSLPYVKSFERGITLRSYTPGWKYVSTDSPTKDMAVIIFGVNGMHETTIITEVMNYETGEMEEMEAPGPVEVYCSMYTLSPYTFSYDNKEYDFTIINENPNYMDSDSDELRPMYQVGNVYIAHGQFSESGPEIFFEPMDFSTTQLTDDQILFYQSSISQYYDDPYMLSQLATKGIFTDFHEVYDITDAWSDIEQREHIFDIDKSTWPQTPADSWQDVFLQVADTYEVVNNSMDCIAIDNCSLIPDFQQGTTSLSSGRFYTDEDDANVAVISELLAEQLKLSVGDTIELNLHCAQGEGDFYDSYFPITGFINPNSNQYEIVGIFENTSSAGLNIYIPARSVLSLFETDGEDENEDGRVLDIPYSYSLGSFLIENGHGVDFQNLFEEIKAPGTKLTIHDQGYMSAAAVFTSMHDTAIILLVGCTVVGISILLLFAYLFVTKQKDSLITMLSLGAGETRAYIYLTSGVMLLSAIAAIVGGVAGYFCAGDVLHLAYETAAKNAMDLTYSAIYSSSAAIESILDITPSVIIAALSSGVIFVVANILCALFAHRVLVSERADESKTPAAARRRFNHSFKHAFRSMRRNVTRSMIVPVIALLIVALLMVYSAVLTDYRNNITELYDSTEISGHYISVNGKMSDNLLLDGRMIGTLWESDALSSVNASINTRYEYLGITEFADGTVPENVEDLQLPTYYSSFLIERAQRDVVRDWSTLVYSSDIKTAPSLSNSTPIVNYLDGYDESIFQTADEVCLIPLALALENDIALGDTIRIAVADISVGVQYFYFDYKVIGFYSSDGTETTGVHSMSREDTIYAPLSSGILMSSNANSSDVFAYGNYTVEEFTYYYIDPATGKVEYFSSSYYDVYNPNNESTYNPFLSDEEQADIAPYTYMPRLNSIRFTLKTGEGVLDGFKDYLREIGVGSQKKLGSTRTAVVIDDNALIQSVEGVQKIIGYMEALYPVLFVLIIAIGFIVSYLLTRTRREELAIMRSAGAGVFKTFSAFFIEQVFLCFVGAVAGFGVIWAIYGFVSTTQVISVLIFFACYIVGVVMSCLIMNRLNVLKLLSANE